jgi:hypothetical protein
MIFGVSWDGLWTLSFGPHNFMVTALGSCVKWALTLHLLVFSKSICTGDTVPFKYPSPGGYSSEKFVLAHTIERIYEKNSLWRSPGYGPNVSLAFWPHGNQLDTADNFVAINI